MSSNANPIFHRTSASGSVRLVLWALCWTRGFPGRAPLCWGFHHAFLCRCEHRFAYWEQTDSKVSSFLIFEGQNLFFSRLRGCNLWCPRHARGSHLLAAFPFALAVALPGMAQAGGIAGFEHSCHVGLVSEGFDVPMMMMLNIYATQNSGV